MKYAIVYCSQTGNTAQLAECLQKVLPQEKVIYVGSPDTAATEADILFVGSWTDKGSCCTEIGQFLRSLENKQVYLFGTAGFGGAPAYFAQISERIAKNLSSTNHLLGFYKKKKKMPFSVRARYEAMAETDPEKAKSLLANFDEALSHPNQADLDGLTKAVSAILKTLREN